MGTSAVSGTGGDGTSVAVGDASTGGAGGDAVSTEGDATGGRGGAGGSNTGTGASGVGGRWAGKATAGGTATGGAVVVPAGRPLTVRRDQQCRWRYGQYRHRRRPAALGLVTAVPAGQDHDRQQRRAQAGRQPHRAQ